MPLKSLLERLRMAPGAAPSSLPFPRTELAVAALLVEAVHIDGEAREDERAVVRRLVRERFRLPEAETARLLQIAEGEFSAALDDWVFTQAVREGFAAEERQAVLEMLWEVVYADGRLARFEDALMSRMGDALGLSPQDANAARERAFARASPAGREGGAE